MPSRPVMAPTRARIGRTFADRFMGMALSSRLLRRQPGARPMVHPRRTKVGGGLLLGKILEIGLGLLDRALERGPFGQAGEISGKLWMRRFERLHLVGVEQRGRSRAIGHGE